MHLKWDVKMDKGKYQQQKIDGIRNEEIRFKVVVATIDEKWWEESLEIVWSCSKESDSFTYEKEWIYSNLRKLKMGEKIWVTTFNKKYN